VETVVGHFSSIRRHWLSLLVSCFKVGRPQPRAGLTSFVIANCQNIKPHEHFSS
jgi:hypothetical protein